ncbi:MAG: hypothetical protein JJ979_02625 [Roseibium sp.]|nr:hypothetical protein [Roseibium sp.]
MSVRLHRAIGYGVPWHRFEELTTLDCEAHETWDKLNKVFETATDELLTVASEDRKNSWTGPNVPIIEKRLLAKNYTDRDRKEAELGKAEDLVCVIDDSCETLGVIFFPNLYYRKRWYRYDDDLDYAFERWREGTDRSEHSDPRQFVNYVDYGHYPFTNSLMTEDGTPHEWLPFWELRERPDLLPAVPSEIRWYLKKLNVMDDAGVNQLRPVVAQWWG